MAKQITAARKTIATLDIQPGQEALVNMVLGLAKAVDADPDNAALWREYNRALMTLREATTPDDEDEAQAFLFNLRTPRPKMGDTPHPN